MVVLNNLKPWKFIQSSTVDSLMKIGLVLLLVLATAFVEISDIDRFKTQDQFSFILFLVPFVPIAVATTLLFKVIWFHHVAKAPTLIERLLFAQRFRNVMTMTCSLSSP